MCIFIGMEYKFIQGVLPLGTSTLYQTPFTETKVVRFTCTCSTAYTFNLSKIDVSLGSTVVLYDLTLDAGDTIVDDTDYRLESEDSLVVETNNAGVNFLLRNADTY